MKERAKLENIWSSVRGRRYANSTNVTKGQKNEKSKLGTLQLPEGHSSCDYRLLKSEGEEEKQASKKGRKRNYGMELFSTLSPYKSTIIRWLSSTVPWVQWSGAGRKYRQKRKNEKILPLEQKALGKKPLVYPIQCKSVKIRYLEGRVTTENKTKTKQTNKQTKKTEGKIVSKWEKMIGKNRVVL